MFLPKSFDEFLKLFTILGLSISFLLGVFQWYHATGVNARQAAFELKKPFLNRQLELYGETTKVAAKLARAIEPADRRILEARFWELYWGELALVENRDVERAMMEFGEALRPDSQPETLQRLSLNLAHAIRGSLDKSWQTSAWTSR